MREMKAQKTSMSAIVYMIFSALFASAGQVFYKYAANHTTDFSTLILNPWLFAGLGSYGIGLLFMLKALRRGELTVIYPVLATSFIFVSIASPIFFKTDFMTAQKWIGILLIIIGVALVGKGRQK